MKTACGAMPGGAGFLKGQVPLGPWLFAPEPFPFFYLFQHFLASFLEFVSIFRFFEFHVYRWRTIPPEPGALPAQIHYFARAQSACSRRRQCTASGAAAHDIACANARKPGRHRLRSRRVRTAGQRPGPPRLKSVPAASGRALPSPHRPTSIGRPLSAERPPRSA